MIRPRALPANPLVSLVAPAGPLAEGAVDRAVTRLEEWGWRVETGGNSRGRKGYLSASDDARAADLQAAIDSDRNDAIWCLRGGYGTMRIIDRIDWGSLLRRPRPVIGFSDNTVLHLALQRAGIVSFHGPHAAVEDLPDFSTDLLRALLTDREPFGELPRREGDPAPEVIVSGGAEGRLVGGNLSLLSATVGTPWVVRGEGGILFFEEIAEAPYRLDRLLTQLRMAGVLRGVRGIVVGALTGCGDGAEGGGATLSELLLDRLGDLGLPVVRGFPFGHQPGSWTLPVGVRARLDATAGTLTLLEPAVA